MRSFILPVTAVALLAAPSLGQVTRNPPGPDPGKRQMDDTTEFTTRSGLGGAAGRLGTQMTTAHWAGATNPIVFQYVQQDQDAATQEPYTFEVRYQDPTTGFPNWLGTPTPAPVFSVPVTAPVGGPGPAAWIWTITPTPAITLSGDQPFYMVWDLPANALWPADGISIHMSSGQPFACGGAMAPACCTIAAPGIGGWEKPRAGVVENMAMSDTPAGTILYGGDDRNHRHWIQFAATNPMLRTMAVNTTHFCAENSPNFGHAAMDPDVNDAGSTGRNDDIGWEVRAGFNFANGAALVYLTESAQDNPIPTGFGDLWISPLDRWLTVLWQGPILLDAAGVGSWTIPLGPPATPERLAVASFGNLHGQGLVFNAAFTEFRLTNLATMRFPLPGATAFSIAAATPATVPAGANRNLKVQNDGKGDVVVEFRGPGNILLGSMTVRERTTINTAVRGGLPPGTLNINITTQNTDPFTNNATTGSYVLLP